ncbi:MAG: DUF721 domain-containing protein [Psychrilyobacter sp.]|uniref:DUF721 domain-containing protein n=1 Tax=Psychrilyobacter sp. TaxID=2586924 RepID=UPI003C78A593
MVKNLVDVSDLMDVAITKSRLLKEGILKSEWDKIVGELSKKSFVIFLKNGKLFVGVENSIWIQQMNFQKQSIIKKTNEFLGGNYVSEIIFKIGKKDTKDYFLKETPKNDSIDLDSVTLTAEEYLQIEVELKEIKDDFIKKQTKIVLEKSYKRKKYLKLHGYKQCKCGVYYSSPESMCAICTNKEVLKLEETLMKAFKNRKMLKYSQAVKVIEDLTEKEYNRIKLKKLSKIKKDIDIYLKNRKDDIAFELSKLYFTIDLGELKDEHIEKRAEEFIQLLKK